MKAGLSLLGAPAWEEASGIVSVRERKSSFVRLFTKTPPGVKCPHFYELVLSNGCPFNCLYCYLSLTFRGNKKPVLFTNPWPCVEQELAGVGPGVFSTGELADSLAVIPPLLESALDYFTRQNEQYLLLVTKSVNLGPLLSRSASPNIIVSFSVNSGPAAEQYELGCPSPEARLQAAKQLKELGWRVRIRLDPLILHTGLEHYEDTARAIAELAPERVTVGSLRQYNGVHNYSPDAPRAGLQRAGDGRMRYLIDVRVRAYEKIAEWLGFQPALCKETEAVWLRLGWRFSGCNCTV